MTTIEQILGQIVRILIIATIFTTVYYFTQYTRTSIQFSVLFIITVLLMPIQVTVTRKIKNE